MFGRKLLFGIMYYGDQLVLHCGYCNAAMEPRNCDLIRVFFYAVQTL